MVAVFGIVSGLAVVERMLGILVTNFKGVEGGGGGVDQSFGADMSG